MSVKICINQQWTIGITFNKLSSGLFFYNFEKNFSLEWLNSVSSAL